MKQFFSLFLTALLVCSSSMPVFASYETLVSYDGEGVSEYLLTVPARLNPGSSGEVKLEGTWPSNETITVTADSFVTLSNDIDSSTKILDISFDGIEQSGSDTESLRVIESISVSDMDNVLFGSWCGEFYYNLSVEDGSVIIPDYAPTFSDNSWEDIIVACETNTVPTTWSVGDTKPMTINGEDYNIQIIGKDHDTYTVGGTAPLTFQLVEEYGTEYPMNSTPTNSIGWSGSAMRTTHLAEILSAMPSEVQSAIKSVDKQTLKGSGVDDTKPLAELETSSDKLFLLSEVEVFGSTTYSNGLAEGSRYSFYADGGSTVKTFNGSANLWWLRGPYYNNHSSFSTIHSSGSLHNNTAKYNKGVSFGFCF